MSARAVEKGGRRPLAAIFGCSGPDLAAAERRFLAAADPLGFILFARNCRDPERTRALVGELRAAVGRPAAPVLIDQEGGRVSRLGPPHWRRPPAAASFSRLDPRIAGEAAGLNARLIAAQLLDLGITVNCAPVLDVPQSGADPVIGERAAGETPEAAARLGRAACEGLLEGGVLPVIKHIPGHGRAEVDSHRALPVVTAGREDLERVDFAPFRALNRMPWAMTAHVLYRALDEAAPATTSSRVIGEVIRRDIGFAGLLVSDDLSMAALSGGPGERARDALAAGCDVVLHCTGEMAEMEAVADACRAMDDTAWERFQRGEAARRTPAPLDVGAATARLESLLEGGP